MYRTAASLGLRADVCAGLSLGEYAALADSEVMALTDCFQIIRKRGMIMQEAYPSGGGMVAVLGLTGEQAETAISGIADVWIANYNCPGQIVISGKLSGLEEASAALTKAGARRCVPLKVSGPFHSPLLDIAGRKLREELRGVNLENPWIPYVTNVDASYVTDCARVKDLLARQIYSSVRWQQSMERLIADGVDTFVEIGPGKTLTNFLKKIDPKVKCYSIETVEEMKRVLEEF